MKRLLCVLTFLVLVALSSPSKAQIFVIQTCGTVPASMKTLVPGAPGMFFEDITGTLCTAGGGGGGGGATALNQTSPNTASGSNLSASITLPATTTQYPGTSLIANSATAGSVANLTWTTVNTGARISRVRLSVNDTTSTAWPSAQINVDLWSAGPTWTNGNLGTWLPATGSAVHLGTFQCTMSGVIGDGYFGECFPTVGNDVLVENIASNTLYGSLEAVNGSGAIGASKTFTAKLELAN